MESAPDQENELGLVAYVDRHLNAWLCASAFENDVKAVWHVKGAQGGHDVVLGPSQLVIGCLCLVYHGQTVRLLSEALLDGEVQTSLVDVNGTDPGRAGGFCKSTGEKANRADTEHKDGRWR